MSNKNDNRASKYDVWINWELIAEMHGWTGSIEEFKKLPIEDLPVMRRVAIKGNR